MSDPRVIAVANQKGGTGKSTVAVNIAAALGADGLRVLVVDVDSQADATSMFGVDPGDHERTLYDVLAGGCELPDAKRQHVNRIAGAAQLRLEADTTCRMAELTVPLQPPILRVCAI